MTTWKSWAASAAAMSLFVPATSGARTVAPERTAPRSPVRTAAYAPSESAALAALRKRVKYVFVLYQENRSFDSYFGTFPGAEGIYSNPPSATPGFTQQIEKIDGTNGPISPFRIGPAQFAADTDDVDHSHPRLIKKIHVENGVPRMNQFAITEERKHIPVGSAVPTLAAKQYGELAMAYEDCDTIPLLWNYAHRFVLYDHIFQSNLGPSTPGNIAIIAAQSGETQYGLHPSQAYAATGSTGPGVPVENDADPAWGPYNPGDGATPANVQYNLTFATLPLTLAGGTAAGVAASDPLRATDFADLGQDVRQLSARGAAPSSWGWFEEGYDREPGSPSATASLANYVTHHNGPQYFGYITNSSERANLHGLGDFLGDVSAGSLPAGAGVFYVKGGYKNILGLKPADPDPAVQTNFVGDDDHPGYSDAQISEATVAEEINRIAASKYWNQSAIVITWDDSEGDYDHVPPPLRAIGPGYGNSPADYLGDGPRVPLIVISPYAKTGAVSHAYGDYGSVVRFVDQVFGLTPLAYLPDERRGRAGAARLEKANFGPDDGQGVSDLLDAFDANRLAGRSKPLPPSYASVNPYFVHTIPQTTGFGCKGVGIVPVDYLRGVANHIPADFNPRPGTDPTEPAVTKAIDTRRVVEDAKDPDD